VRGSLEKYTSFIEILLSELWAWLFIRLDALLFLSDKFQS
jgi:hypothetical protein